MNDELPALTQETAPIRINGVTYIPATIFDRRVAGVGLGVSYAWDAKAEKVTLYTESKILEFNIKTGLAYSYEEDREYAYPAALRNGMPYLPAVSACTVFDISVDFLSTDDLKYQLLRLRNGNEVLDNRMYMRSVRPLLEERANQQTLGEDGNKNPGGTGQVTPPPTVMPPEVVEEETTTNQPVYLSVRVNTATEVASLVDSLSVNGRLKAVFFFPVDRLVASDELLRELVGRGHKIGLIPTGKGIEEQLRSLQAGNDLLKHILRQRAMFVLDEGFSEETKAAMHAEAFLPWKPNITLSAGGKSDSAIYQSAMQQIEARKGRLRLLLDDQVKGGTLSSVIRQLVEDGYDLRALRETDC